MSASDPISALSGAQRSFLRGRAHALLPLVRVGQAGITAAVLAAVATALRDHELVKVRLDRPADKHGLSAQLAAGTDSALVGLLGHTVTLYRAHPEAPVLVLPGAGTGTSPRVQRTRTASRSSDRA